jgi:hypothetical protein
MVYSHRKRVYQTVYMNTEKFLRKYGVLQNIARTIKKTKEFGGKSDFILLLTKIRGTQADGEVVSEA